MLGNGFFFQPGQYLTCFSTGLCHNIHSYIQFEHFRRNLTKKLVVPSPAQEVQSLRHYLKDDTKLFCLVFEPLWLGASPLSELVPSGDLAPAFSHKASVMDKWALVLVENGRLGGNHP